MSDTEVTLPDEAPRRIALRWEIGTGRRDGEEVVEVPAGATDEEIEEIAMQFACDDAGFGWGWEAVDA